MEFEPVEKADNKADPESKILRKLRWSLGLDTDAALSFCGGDYDLYREILGDYVNNSDTRKGELDEYYENADWQDFEVKIHAMKSSSKTIGAMELFEKALSLEEAAGREDEAFIRKVYPEFAEEYLKKVKSLREIIEA